MNSLVLAVQGTLMLQQPLCTALGNSFSHSLPTSAYSSPKYVWRTCPVPGTEPGFGDITVNEAGAPSLKFVWIRLVTLSSV